MIDPSLIICRLDERQRNIIQYPNNFSKTDGELTAIYTNVLKYTSTQQDLSATYECFFCVPTE